MFNRSMEEILQAIRDSLAAVTQDRFYETERGFQGEFGAHLRYKLPEQILEDGLIDQEFQKTLKEHGIRIRPDIVIHVPFEGSGLASRAEGNYAVIEFKLRANAASAIDDYNNLSTMCERLDYPLGVFINIDSDHTHFDEFQGPFKERLHAFSVQLVNGTVMVKEQ